jgi:hypothetical protein
MAISQSRYVNITSGVGAGSPPLTRDLIARLFTENPLVPTGSVVEFDNADDVGTYFGTTSTEYLRAQFYFGWISKSITSPQKISYAFWANVAVGSKIFGKPATYLLSTFTAISAGSFTLQMGGFTHTFTGIDFSAAGSLSVVASTLQTAIRAFSGGGAAFTSATVTYDAVRSCFDLVSGTTGADVISVTAGVSNDIAAPLGWLTGAILSNGSAAQTITEVLTQSSQLSNNFGSFAFIPSLTQQNILDAATWNDGQNVSYLYSIPVSASNAVSYSAMLFNLSGCTMTLAPLSTEYPEQAPMMIMAATDYTAPNSVQNYMFQQFDLTASVTTDTDANTYDALRVNYYGQTQSAGTLLAFYQRGLMFGASTDPLDQNTYANEVWLKQQIAADLMALLISSTRIPANLAGRGQVLTVIQSDVNLALLNGTISVGKALTTQQQLYITTISNDPNAWRQVQNTGYWLNAVIQPYTVDSSTQYKIVYTLIYSKDDDIRLIEGRDILI